MVLPGVRADDDADLVFLDVEGEIVDGLEAVEGNGERFDREQELFWLMTDEHGDLLTPPAQSATELLVPGLRFAR